MTPLLVYKMKAWIGGTICMGLLNNLFLVSKHYRLTLMEGLILHWASMPWSNCWQIFWTATYGLVPSLHYKLVLSIFETLSACCCMNILMACSCFWIYCTNTKSYKPIDRTLPWKPTCKGRVGQGLIYTCLSLHLIHVGHFNFNIPPCSAANIHDNSLYQH